MKLVIIFGPQAVGKMTVGQELQKLTNFKLFHNHMTIDLVSNFFSYGSQEGRRLSDLIRKEIFEEVSKTNLEGLIFTYVWAFDEQSDWDYIENLHNLFDSKGAGVYYVELEADIKTRLERNITPNRLENKPTKRDVAWTKKDILKTAKKYRLNSNPKEIKHPNYIKIDNTEKVAQEVAKEIADKFHF